MDTENKPYTPLELCNAALSKIGEAPIEALSPNHSSAAKLCYLHYHPARRETLCMSRWTFATKSVLLEKTNESSTPRFKHPYSFLLPVDCLRVMDVECSSWTMRGRKIQATSSTLPLTYIADMEDCSLFDPLFSEALITHLAEKLAVPLTSSQSLRQNLAQEFHKIILPLAATTNAVQSHSNDSNPLHNIIAKHRRNL